MRKPNLKILINGKSFNTEHIFCDICGWGDTLIFTDIKENKRTMDFCKRHSEKAIANYIDMNLPPYKTHSKPMSESQ